jgi:hypothetical protein
MRAAVIVIELEVRPSRRRRQGHNDGWRDDVEAWIF